MADWFLLIRASRYLGVAAWDLLEKSAMWTELALAAQRAETNAQYQLRQRGH
jgi:hypothetical protein